MTSSTSPLSAPASPHSDFPIGIDDVIAARERLRPFLATTAARSYPTLDEHVGHGIRVIVKHENHHPTQSFKVRNALSAITSLSRDERERGVIGASTGNHGQGLAWAGTRLGVRVTICVPVGNNPEKNAAMRSLGAELIEEGASYDEAVAVAARLVAERGATLIHSTNHKMVLAGAGTLTLELLEQEPELDALFVAVGGGSQAVGAIAVARAIKPSLRVYGVQSVAASAVHDSWKVGHEVKGTSTTFAEGIATGRAYALTLGALRAGLAGFVLVTEKDLAESIRTLIATTHNLPEGAAGAGLAGILAMRDTLAGARVGMVMCGGNMDSAVLRRILNGEL